MSKNAKSPSKTFQGLSIAFTIESKLLNVVYKVIYYLALSMYQTVPPPMLSSCFSHFDTNSVADSIQPLSFQETLKLLSPFFKSALKKTACNGHCSITPLPVKNPLYFLCYTTNIWSPGGPKFHH